MAGLRQCGWAVLLSLAGLGRAQEPVRTADARCARCHGEIVRRYLETPMANASGLATERLLPGAFTHAASGVRYEVRQEKGGAALTFADGRDARIAGRPGVE